MNRLFHTAPLDAGSWLYITGVGFAAWCVVEFEKMDTGEVRPRDSAPVAGGVPTFRAICL